MCPDSLGKLGLESIGHIVLHMRVHLMAGNPAEFVLFRIPVCGSSEGRDQGSQHESASHERCSANGKCLSAALLQMTDQGADLPRRAGRPIRIRIATRTHTQKTSGRLTAIDSRLNCSRYARTREATAVRLLELVRAS